MRTFVIAMCLVLLGCIEEEPTPPADDDGGDDDAGDDATGDDDTGDDDTGDDDTAVDPPGWAWGEVNTVDDADASLVGEVAEDFAGCHMLAPGDMSGDGIDDLVVGAFGNDEMAQDAGKIYFVFGREQGDWSLDEPLAPHPSVKGFSPIMKIAKTVRLGDVNGDGLADLAVDPGFHGSSSHGQYLVKGKTEGWETSENVGHLETHLVNFNEDPHCSTDSSIGDLGDVDGDGLDDWFLSGPVLFGGEAHAVSGVQIVGDVMIPQDSVMWVHGALSGDARLRPIGDVDGDGLGDLYGESDAMPGVFALLFGSAGGLPWDEDLSTVVDTLIAHAGKRELIELQVVGDVTGDGLRDVAVSAPYPDNEPGTGMYLFAGREDWPAMITTDSATSYLAPGYPARPAEPVGDLDGDGIDELVFAAPGDDPGDATDVYIARGRMHWPSVLLLEGIDVHIAPAQWETEIHTWRWREHHRGDLDGDGVADLFLSNPGASNDMVVDTGAIYVFRGRPSWPAELSADDADVTFAGSVQSQKLGDEDRSLVADLDGDGIDDLVTSSMRHPVGTEEGETFVFFGQPLP